MANMRPQAITKVSISALAISLPIIYVSLLRVPPSTLARDSTFWFLMSNSIIAIIAADSGMLFFSSDDDLSNDQTVQEDYHDPMSDETTPPAPVDISGGEQLPTGGAVSCKATNIDMNMEEGHALAMLKGEGAARNPKTDTGDASVLLRKRQEEEEEEEEASVVLEPISGQWTIPQARIKLTPDDHAQQDRDEGSFEVAGEEMKPRRSVTEEERDDNLSNVPGDQTVQEDYHNTMSVPSHEPTVPSGIGVIVGGGEQLPTGRAVSCKAASTDMHMEEDHALALLKGEGDTGHASVLRRHEEEEAAAASVVLEPITANKKDAMMVKGDQWTIPQARITVTPDDHVPQGEDEDFVEVVREPRWLVTEEQREYWQLSDEELNRKVEEFITRFNRDMIQQEAAVSSTVRIKD